MTPFKIDDCFEVRHALGQHPAVARLANDDLLLMYGDLTDQMEAQTGHVLRSVDGGRTWSDPELVLRPRWWQGGTHTSLGMTALKSGRMLIPWTHGGNIKKRRESPTRFVCLRSDDNGHTWQGWDEQPTGMHRVSPYGKILELPDGTVLCPAWGQARPDDPYVGTSFVLRSHDQGVTWLEHSLIADRHANGANETDVTLLPDGRLLALIRTSGEEQADGPTLFWTDYSHSEDGGHTWSEPERTNVLGQNFNAWVCPDGVLVAACRGIHGTGHRSQEDLRPDDQVHTDQPGFGIHFFIAEDGGSRWQYQFTLPDPKGREYTAWHEAGEPCFCDLPDGRLFIAYYSYDESIFEQIEHRPPNDFIASEMRRIPHVFKRRICACILSRT